MNNHILLIGNDRELSLRLKTYLENRNFSLYTCQDAIKGINEVNCDIILLDIDMPNVNNLSLLKNLQTITSVPVIVLTAENNPFNRIYALESGADDYILKSVDDRELLARVRISTRRFYNDNSIDKNILIANNTSLCRSKREVHEKGDLIELTGLEFEILYLLMSNAGKIVSKVKISETLFNRTVSRHDRSIDMHICSIRKKLSINTSSTKIKTIRGMGYSFLQ